MVAPSHMCSDNPLARPGAIRELLLSLPEWLLHVATWGVLGLELSFAPLALVRRLRPWLWLIMLLMHLGLIVVIDFADLSLGMVMLHLFTFDPGWVKAWRQEDSPSSVTSRRADIAQHENAAALMAEQDGEFRSY